jgi:hypothetical protein
MLIERKLNLSNPIDVLLPLIKLPQNFILVCNRRRLYPASSGFRFMLEQKQKETLNEMN